jgi:hypothetical protein
MKLVKSLAIGALALATVASSQATNVKVTGSTAYRKALYSAIVNQLSVGGTKTVHVAWFGNAALNSANEATFSNGTDSFQVGVAGSVGGVNWVVNNLTVAQDKDRVGVATGLIKVASANGSAATATVATTQGALVVTSGAGQIATLDGTNSEAGAADFTLSDSLQDSTPYDEFSTGVTLTQAGTTATSGTGIGVVPFVFAKGTAGGIGGTGTGTAYSRFTNVTPLAFQALAKNGYSSLALFTGTASDNSYNAVLTGRDNDSGTRLATAFESGFGDVNSPFKQYSANNATFVDVGSGATITSLTLGATTAAGYSSGGKVKNALNASITSSVLVKSKPVILVSYLGTGDLPTDATQILSYNGVALFSSTGVQNPALIQNGQYTFWTYEQAYYNPNVTTDATVTGIIDAIADSITNNYAASAGGIHINTLNVSRASEGAVVFHN